jgi:WD40 repeat protein
VRHPVPPTVVPTATVPRTIVEQERSGKKRGVLFAVVLLLIAIAAIASWRTCGPGTGDTHIDFTSSPSTTVDVRPDDGATAKTSTAAALSTASGATLHGHTKSVNTVAYSPDGRWIASAGEDAKLIIWDAATQKAVRSFDLPGTSSHVVFAPDGNTIAAAISYSASDNRAAAVIVDATSGEIRKKILSDAGLVLATDFSPDGKLLAFGDGPHLRIWNLAENRELWNLELHQNAVAVVKFSPGGDVVASGSHDGRIALVSPATGTVVGSIQGRNNIRALAFSNDGAKIAWGCYEDYLQVSAVKSGALLKRIEIPSMVNAIDYSPDGSRIAVAPNVAGKMMLLDAGELTTLKSWQDAEAVSVSSLDFSPDSHSLVANSANGVRVWVISTIP